MVRIPQLKRLEERKCVLRPRAHRPTLPARFCSRAEVNTLTRPWHDLFRALCEEGILDLSLSVHRSSLQAVCVPKIQECLDAWFRGRNLSRIRSIKRLRGNPLYVAGVPREIYAASDDCSIR